MKLMCSFVLLSSLFYFLGFLLFFAVLFSLPLSIQEKYSTSLQNTIPRSSLSHLPSSSE